MSFSVFGFFSQTLAGFSGALLYVFGHGFISAGLFFLVGMIYNRWGSRLLKYYSGLSLFPYLSFFLLFFSFANIGFPGTVNFISESLIFISLIEQSKILVFLMMSVMFVGSLVYSIWTYLRVANGSIRQEVYSYGFELERYELLILLYLVILTLIFGVKPNFFFDYFILNILF